MLGSFRVDGKQQSSLRPFLLKLRDSYLIGLTPEPEQGSPCVHCVELWLAQRRVWSERLHITELPIRKELVTTLQKENHPHVLYEISNDGTETKMDCFVYPHPACGCDKNGFVAPREFPARLNFAFSPISQIKCARYGIPNGNLWLTSASGHLEGETIRVFGTGMDREVSRLKAVEQWMKIAAAHIFKSGTEGHVKPAEDFVTGDKSSLSLPDVLKDGQCFGAGKDREDAIRDALQEFSRIRTLGKYTSQMKKPMLIVGANNWMRNHVPFFLLQQFDLHLFFYPTSSPCWVVGLAALSRMRTTDAPIFIFESSHDVGQALSRVLGKMLEHCRPVDWMSDTEEVVELSETEMARNRKLSSWWNNWIYRCPKISLKDVLHLEAYTDNLELWRQYLADGQERLKIVDLNTPLLPASLRHVVKIAHPCLQERVTTNINGIGTLSSFLR